MRRASRSDSVSFTFYHCVVLMFANALTSIGTFIETSMPVVDYYRTQGKVVDVSSVIRNNAVSCD